MWEITEKSQRAEGPREMVTFKRGGIISVIWTPKQEGTDQGCSPTLVESQAMGVVGWRKSGINDSNYQYVLWQHKECQDRDVLRETEICEIHTFWMAQFYK